MIELKTKYKPYKEINETEFIQRNQWKFKFENGYGASVICHTLDGRITTYGNKERPFELAVLFFDGDECTLSYDTPLTDDVIGYLTNEEVEKYLEEIEKL